MRVLVVKTSSLGDVIHTLPALTDAVRAIPGIQFDWVVEEAFAEIPAWHPGVNSVITVAARRWRRHLFTSLKSGEMAYFKARLQSRNYDLIIDAQGLLKSAVVTRLARGQRCGLDRNSAREPLAALIYQQKVHIPKQQHAVTRVRQLFAGVLDYKPNDSSPDYGITNRFARQKSTNKKYLVFLHGTTWATKHWPESCWRRLAELVRQDGLDVKLPWSTVTEKTRAEKIAAVGQGIEVLPRLNLTELAVVLSGAAGVVGVDTGLIHLAAALGMPSVTIYGATDPTLTGTVGHSQQHLQADFPCSPCLSRKCTYKGSAQVWPACYQSVSPRLVWQELRRVISLPG